MDKQNYRPVSAWSSLPKVFERLIYDKLSSYYQLSIIILL